MISALLFAADLPTADSLSVFDPASPPAYSIRELFWLVLGITGFIFILVEGMLVYCWFRFRTPRQGDDGHEPPQIYGSNPVEVAWTVAPLLIVFVLFLLVTRTVFDVHKIDPPEGALEITVVGHQWWWEFRYHDPDDPHRRIVCANEMHVPVDRPVFLRLESVDVIHSFWIPRLAGKMDVVPHHTNVLWFNAEKAGLYQGQCAEYCGNQHANMLLNVYVDDDSTFNKWFENQKQPARTEPVKEDLESFEAGRDLFLKTACVNCHTVRGTFAKGTFGPDLTHLMSRKTIASGLLLNDPQHLHDWVDNPQATNMKPGCWMPSFHLTQKEVASIVNYLKELD
ncbi:MAG: cytochrome c oxidase subunit II [Gemmataceae bacterium]